MSTPVLTDINGPLTVLTHRALRVLVPCSGFIELAWPMGLCAQVGVLNASVSRKSQLAFVDHQIAGTTILSRLDCAGRTGLDGWTGPDRTRRTGPDGLDKDWTGRTGLHLLDWIRRTRLDGRDSGLDWTDWTGLDGPDRPGLDG